MKSIKLSKLLRMVRAQADYEDSNFVSDLELVDTLNLLRTELYTQIIDRCNPPKMVKEMTLVAVSGVVEVPEEVYKIIGVYRDGSELSEIHYSHSSTKQLSQYNYMLQGDNIISANPALDIRYYPVIAEIELPDEDENNEWLEDPEIALFCPEEVAFLRAGLVEYILSKDESDSSTAIRAKMEAYARILSTFQQASVQPHKVRKVW